MESFLGESRRHDQVLAFRTSEGRVLGFHSRNLEVAELSPEIWQSFLETQKSNPTEAALEALEEWNSSSNPHLKKDPASRRRLSSLTINVTQICNLACTYCAAGGNGTYGDPVKKISVEKTLPQLRSLMARAEKHEPFLLTFLGGEPLLYPEGIRILADVARDIANELEIPLKFSVVTNGTRFTPENRALLRDLKADVTISFDGTPEMNDRHRLSPTGRGVGKQVLAGLRSLLQERGDIPSIGLSGVFSGEHPDLETAWHFYRSQGVDWFDFTYDHDAESPTASETFTRELVLVARKAFALGGENELRRIQTFNRYFEALDRQQQTENYCGAGKNFLMIDARNQITTCPWLIGEVDEMVGVDTHIWENRLNRLADPLIEKNNCGQCWARYLCGGGCMYVHRQRTGNKHQVDPLFCQRMKGVLAVTLELYLEARLNSSQFTENQVEHG